MPRNIARANARKSAIRAAVESFAHQKTRFGLFIRSIEAASGRGQTHAGQPRRNFDRLMFGERHRGWDDHHVIAQNRVSPGSDPLGQRCRPVQMSGPCLPQ